MARKSSKKKASKSTRKSPARKASIKISTAKSAKGSAATAKKSAKSSAKSAKQSAASAKKAAAAARKSATKKPEILKPGQRDLASLRKALSALKKKGLITTKKRANTLKRSDTRLVKQVKDRVKYLTTNASVNKLNQKQAKEFKDAGFVVVNSRLILPQEPDEKIYTRGPKGGRKVWRAKSLGGKKFRSQILPVGDKNLDAFMRKVADPAFQSMLPKNGKWAFKFFGHRSHQTFSTLEQLANYFKTYAVYRYALATKNTQLQSEVVERLEFFVVDDAYIWYAAEPTKKRRKKKKGYARKRG